MQDATIEVFRKGILFLRLTRPIFLAGGALLYAFGAAAAVAAGWTIDWNRYLLGQMLVTCIQLFAQYSNEYFDYDTDRLNVSGRTWFSGGSGVLPAGAFAEETAFHAARVTGITALALVFGTLFEEPLVSLIGFAAIAGAWFYSAPPLSLAGSGYGEWVTSVIVCALVPITGAILQTGGPLPFFLVSIIPLLFIHTAMLIVFALPDVDSDKQTGKATIVVRRGQLRAAVWHHRLILIGYALIAAQTLFFQAPARLVWATLPLALWQIKSVSAYVRLPSKNPNRLTLGAVALFALSAGLLLVDLLMLQKLNT